MPVLTALVNFLIHPATVVILLILGIAFIIIITILICVKVCIIGMAGSDEDDDWSVHLRHIYLRHRVVSWNDSAILAYGTAVFVYN